MADSPIDFIPEAGLVTVHQKFKKRVLIWNIDIGVIEDLSGLAKAIKPTRLLAYGPGLKLSRRSESVTIIGVQFLTEIVGSIMDMYGLLKAITHTTNFISRF